VGSLGYDQIGFTETNNADHWRSGRLLLSFSQCAYKNNALAIDHLLSL
jgi:hypothetical protein